MRKYQINLKPKEVQNFPDKLIYFFLHYLRYVIVMTQIVVIGVFFFRFQVDQEIIDLKESIGQKEEIIKVTKPLVADAKTISEKIQLIKTQNINQKNFSSIVFYILSTVPRDITLESFKLEKQSILIQGTSLSVSSIKSYIALYQNDNQFNKVTLSDITKDSTGYAFSIIFNLKKYD